MGLASEEEWRINGMKGRKRDKDIDFVISSLSYIHNTTLPPKPGPINTLHPILNYLLYLVYSFCSPLAIVLNWILLVPS